MIMEIKVFAQSTPLMTFLKLGFDFFEVRFWKPCRVLAFKNQQYM